MRFHAILSSKAIVIISRDLASCEKKDKISLSIYNP